ncbi:MAG: AAA family ATPase [Rhodobacteraceae bacterium]|nr:AAA family ATPase [Paracoccaceae bacterium]
MLVIACYSNKGGVGKTATAVNLAHLAAQSGLSVLLCDLDPQGASSFYFRVKPAKKLKEALFFQSGKRFSEAIRGSDYDKLDILPANMSYRDFDVFLSQMKKGQTRLRRVLKREAKDYDLVVLDCPPNISTLSENVFLAADKVVVPVIPSTLSERTFKQLLAFLKEQDNTGPEKVLGFFSMVQARKSMHVNTMARMRIDYKKRMLATEVPFSADIEKMGVHRAPVASFAAGRAGSTAYEALWSEIQAGLDG